MADVGRASLRFPAAWDGSVLLVSADGPRLAPVVTAAVRRDCRPVPRLLRSCRTSAALLLIASTYGRGCGCRISGLAGVAAACGERNRLAAVWARDAGVCREQV